MNMGRDFTQEAYDEYYSTGIDPTGGEIGPDFDPETGEYLDDQLEEEETPAPAEESFLDRLDSLEAAIDRELENIGGKMQADREKR